MANLINLSQIKGGKLLQQTVDALNASYPASKVTTEVNKKANADGSSNGTYTAQELLAELKSNMDKLNGDGGEGSINDRIKNAVKTITDRKISDYVRLWIVGYNSTTDLTLFKLTNQQSEDLLVNGVANLPNDTGLTVTNDELKKITLDKAYPVYTYKNEPVLNSFKKNITVTFKKDATTDKITYSLSDVPCKFSEEKTSTDITGESVTIESDKKTLTLANKYISTKNFVLKDKDGNAIPNSKYYLKAIAGKIIFRQEQEANSTYTVDYTYTSYTEKQDLKPSNPYVKTTDNTKAEGCFYKIYPIETTTIGELDTDYLLDNSEMVNVANANALINISNNIAKDEDLQAQIVEMVADASIQQALQTISEDLNSRLEAVEAKLNTSTSYITDTFDTLIDKQTVFNLSHVPTDKLVACYINGIRYFENTYFTVDRTTQAIDGNKGYQPTVTWLFTSAKNGFDLDSNFEVVFEYLADSSKTMYVVPQTDNSSDNTNHSSN